MLHTAMNIRNFKYKIKNTFAVQMEFTIDHFKRRDF